MIYACEGFFWISIPKNASRSIFRSFIKGETFYKNPKILPKKSFVIVRDPYSRVLSARAMFRRFYYKKFFDTTPDVSIEDLFKREDKAVEIHMRPQSEFIEVCPERIFRFENLERDWKEISNYLEVPVPDYTHIGENTWTDDLTREEIFSINYKYGEDFENFGYNIRE